MQVLLAIVGCSGQTKPVHLSDIQFKSIFGYITKDSSQVYCLLGTGFFRAPSSKNSDSLIQYWLTNHPNAQVITVSTLNNPKDKLSYCWLVDKTDTINNFLIKNGCYPGGTMMRPETYAEMSDEMKAIYKGMEKPDITVHIDKMKYDNFIEQIKAAETFAETNKLGIWNEQKRDD